MTDTTNLRELVAKTLNDSFYHIGDWEALKDSFAAQGRDLSEAQVYKDADAVLTALEDRLIPEFTFPAGHRLVVEHLASKPGFIAYIEDRWAAIDIDGSGPTIAAAIRDTLADQ